MFVFLPSSLPFYYSLPEPKAPPLPQRGEFNETIHPWASGKGVHCLFFSWWLSLPLLALGAFEKPSCLASSQPVSKCFCPLCSSACFQMMGCDRRCPGRNPTLLQGDSQEHEARSRGLAAACNHTLESRGAFQ